MTKKKGSLCATSTVIVVAIRVRVSGVVTVGYTGVRRIIVPIAAAKARADTAQDSAFYDATPFLSPLFSFAALLNKGRE